MEFEISKSVAFTGHRPNKLGGYNENNPIMITVKEVLSKTIDELIAEGYTHFISGMAIGVDMVAAELVLEKRKKDPNIFLICAVPFEGQENLWPEPIKKRYFDILNQADEVVYISYPGYAGWKMQKRNEWMVDHANVIVAVWDGTKGGTENCVKYAFEAPHKPKVMNVYPFKSRGESIE
ncbi:MAG: SLOG family protein [Tepidibacillus sp.]